MRSFFDFRALGSVYFERGGAADLDALAPLLATELPAAQYQALRSWWVHHAAVPWVVRSAPGQLVAATLSIDLASLGDRERESDPVLAAVWRALHDVAPPRVGDLQLVARWSLAEGGQRRPSAAMNALQMAQFFQWLTLPQLGAFVICVEHPDHWLPLMRHLGLSRLATCDLVVDGVPVGCYLQDLRALPITRWFERMADREVGSGPPETRVESPALQRLARPEFDRAVREALRLLDSGAALATNPLTASAAVRAAAVEGEAPWATLRRLVLDAAQALKERPRDAKFWRALEATYVHPVGSQELAAERLGLPFGTYRYQLATGIERVAKALWARETG